MLGATTTIITVDRKLNESDGTMYEVYIHPNRVHVESTFPPMRYRRVKSFTVPVNRDKLVFGGSYNIHCDTPWFEQRCHMFEENIFPYDHDFLHISARRGVLLMPYINLHLMTDLRNPCIVYLLNKFGRYVAKFKFSSKCITYSELVE